MRNDHLKDFLYVNNQGLCDDILNLRQDTLSLLQDWSKKYGRVFGYFVGLRPQLQVTDVDIVKEIFIKQFSNFMNRPVRTFFIKKY